MATRSYSSSASVVLLLLLLIMFMLSWHPHLAAGITQKELRPGELSDAQAQQELLENIEDTLNNAIRDEHDYRAGNVFLAGTNLHAGLRVHISFMLVDAGGCQGHRGSGVIYGWDLFEVFANNMLSVIQGQVRAGFGSGVVVESVDNQALINSGLLAQFYYWIERQGQTNVGGVTPTTREASGPPDINPHRGDELYFTKDILEEERIPSLTRTANSISITNKTYWVRPPRPNNKERRNDTRSRAMSTHKDDDVEACLPYNFALFTSLYDINVIASPSLGVDYPSTLSSPNGLFCLTIQDDCNLVLYATFSGGTRALWSCGDACYLKGTKCFARINLDGTFAVYNGNGVNLWFTPTQCSSGPGCWSNTYLIMQDDGNLVLYLLDTNVPIWASNTVVS